mgnify:CR=1 FL=1
MTNVRSDIWNQGFEDGILGLDQDDDYVIELHYKEDIEDYIDGFEMGSEYFEKK